VAIAALLASLLICLTAAPALAQSIPLPTPRPALTMISDLLRSTPACSAAS